MDVAVVVVGDEILGGYVRDENAHFIATRVAEHGHRLRRVAIVADRLDEIVDEVRDALRFGAGLVVVCGGLGPTHDDVTMEAVAAALGLPLEPCPALVERVEELIAHATERGFSDASFGVDSLRKMALAPAGAEMLANSRGVLPAVAIAHGDATVAVLPGPPRLLEIVFTECVEPRYLAGTGVARAREEITHPFPESAIADLLTDLAARFPASSIGSYPQRAHTLVRIAGAAEEVAEIASAVRDRLDTLMMSDEGRRFLEFVEERRRANRDAAT